LSQPFLISVEGSLFDAKLADHTDIVERVTVKSLLKPDASLFNTHDSDSCLVKSLMGRARLLAVLFNAGWAIPAKLCPVET